MAIHVETASHAADVTWELYYIAIKFHLTQIYFGRTVCTPNQVGHGRQPCAMCGSGGRKFKTAPSLHLPVDGANSPEVEMTPSGWLVLRPARREPVELRKGCSAPRKVLACRFALTGWPLAQLTGQLQRHFSLAIMAVLFSISNTKSPIFAGRLCCACAYYSGRILYLAVFSEKAIGKSGFQEVEIFNAV